MGEVDRLQQLLDTTKRADPDVSAITVLNGESKAVASTDAALKHQVLTRTEFERAMAHTSTFVNRAVPDARATFEAAVPIALPQPQPKWSTL
jgi:hypothetical protein